MHSLIPVIVDKLFQWSIVDKVYWKGIQFYYLTDNGKEMLSRILSIKDTSKINQNESVKKRLSGYLRRFILFSVIWSLKIKKNTTKIDGDDNRFWLRAVARVPNGPSHTFFVVSLIFFDNDWVKNLDNFITTYKDEVSSGRVIKGVFLISNFDSQLLQSWIAFFKTVGVTNIYRFMTAVQGGSKLFDEKGNEINLLEWCNEVGFGKVSRNESTYATDEVEIQTYSVNDDDSEEIETVSETNEIDETEFDSDDEVADFDDSDDSDNFNEDEFNIVKDSTPTMRFKKDKDVPLGKGMKAPDKALGQRYIDIVSKQLKALPSDEDRMVQGILFTATRFFVEGNSSRAMMWLHMLATQQLSKNEDWAMNLAVEIGYILDDPMIVNQPQMRNIDPFDFWDSYFAIPKVNVSELHDHLNLAALIKAFFAPPEPMSFQIKSRWNQINDDRSNIALKTYPSTKKLINLFKNFAEQTHCSFASCISVDHSTVEIELKNALELIKTMHERADAIIKIPIKHPRTKGLVKKLYDTDGEIRKLLNVETSRTLFTYCSQFTDVNFDRIENQVAVTSEDIFSEIKVGNYLDEIWSSIKVDSHKNEKFTGVERNKQIRLFIQALTALIAYAFAKKHADTLKSSGHQKAPIAKALELLNDIVDEFSQVDQKITINLIGPAIFIVFIENLAVQMTSKERPLFYRECLLGSKYFELTTDGIPFKNSYRVASFRLANHVIEFNKAMENLTVKEAANVAYETAVRSCDLGVLKLLEANYREYIDRSDEELKRRQDNVTKLVDRQLDRIYHEFLDNLELDRNYDRITNQDKIDFYVMVATAAKEHYSQTKNAGIFQRFVNACKNDILLAAQPHKNALEQRLNTLKEKLESELSTDEDLDTKYPILAEIHRQLTLGNLTVAEDYLNRWNDNNAQLNINFTESQNEAFEDFLDNYEFIFTTCISNKSDSLEKIYSRMRSGNAKNRSERDATSFVNAWQGLNTDLKARAEASVVELINHLSFDTATVDKSEKVPPNQWNFQLSFPNYKRSKAAYPHCFAVYGTEIASKGLAVIYLASNRTADNIVETLSKTIKPDCGIICLVDCALSLAQRRKIAQAFKLRPDLKNIVVIDRVMAIFLTRFEDSVRGVKFLNAALPFARVQPYTTGGVVAPEMFIGRSKELAKIQDMAGPVFVYGGRQLGKSALLRQVRNIVNDPQSSNFAFFIDLKGLDSDKSLDKIVRELKDSKLIDEGEVVGSWDDFSLTIRNLMKSEVAAPKKLMLLLDESDEFLASVETSANRAIDVLRELRETFAGSFKFVLAGLHKVIRFEKNSSFGNLDHISILPFTPTDALELLLKPMSCLGFTIEDESLMSAIFSRANYYPGLIQYYCKMIVDAAADNYAQRNFDATKNPPYKLDDQYLKNMLGKRDFQEEINKKFQITLKLDDDNFYEVIALVIALAYYESNRPVHVSLDKIRETCLLYDIDKIAQMSNSQLESLLGEMVELNLLRKVDDMYEFNRYAFWHMLGNEDEVSSRLASILD